MVYWLCPLLVRHEQFITHTHFVQSINSSSWFRKSQVTWRDDLLILYLIILVNRGQIAKERENSIRNENEIVILHSQLNNTNDLFEMLVEIKTSLKHLSYIKWIRYSISLISMIIILIIIFAHTFYIKNLSAETFFLVLINRYWAILQYVTYKSNFIITNFYLRIQIHHRIRSQHITIFCRNDLT